MGVGRSFIHFFGNPSVSVDKSRLLLYLHTRSDTCSLKDLHYTTLPDSYVPKAIEIIDKYKSDLVDVSRVDLAKFHSINNEWELVLLLINYFFYNIGKGLLSFWFSAVVYQVTYLHLTDIFHLLRVKVYHLTEIPSPLYLLYNHCYRPCCGISVLYPLKGS